MRMLTLRPRNQPWLPTASLISLGPVHKHAGCPQSAQSVLILPHGAPLVRNRVALAITTVEPRIACENANSRQPPESGSAKGAHETYDIWPSLDHLQSAVVTPKSECRYSRCALAKAVFMFLTTYIRSHLPTTSILPPPNNALPPHCNASIPHVTTFSLNRPKNCGPLTPWSARSSTSSVCAHNRKLGSPSSLIRYRGGKMMLPQPLPL